MRIQTLNTWKSCLPLFLVLVLALCVMSPEIANARMDYTAGSGMAEGDPGDGDESMGGGTSGSDNPPFEFKKIEQHAVVFNPYTMVPSFGASPNLFVFPLGQNLGFFDGVSNLNSLVVPGGGK